MAPLFQVDAFATEPFRGNPAAVCILDTPADEQWMQSVAAEMNLSETAFLAPGAVESHFALRWFTPTAEVDLCGHATLASAHVLWETGRVPGADTVSFHTASGVLTAAQSDSTIWMDFPALASEPVDAVPGLAGALGISPLTIGRNVHDYIVELASPADVTDLRPDFASIAALETRAVVVTAHDDGGDHDFVSRCFAPRVGIPEDPVTGSAHCALGPWWAERLGRNDLIGYQASARGGHVHVHVRGDRVLLGGSAVTVLRGDLG
jgi:PhzF family phenazine biosynthesis protein